MSLVLLKIKCKDMSSVLKIKTVQGWIVGGGQELSGVAKAPQEMKETLFFRTIKSGLTSRNAHHYLSLMMVTPHPLISATATDKTTWADKIRCSVLTNPEFFRRHKRLKIHLPFWILTKIRNGRASPSATSQATEAHLKAFRPIESTTEQVRARNPKFSTRLRCSRQPHARYRNNNHL